MRVPVLDPFTAVPGGAAYGNTAPVERQAVDAVGAGLQGLGDTLDKAGQMYAGVKKKAFDTKKASALAQQQREATPILVGDSEAGTRGFFSAEGVNASEGSGYALEALHESQQKLADQFTDPEERAAFLVDSNQLLDGYHKQVETHVAQQFRVAQLSAAKGLEAETIKGITSGAVPEEAAGLHSAIVENHIRDLAPSPEAADAQISEFRAKLATGRIAQALAPETLDIPKAEKLLEENRGVLGGEVAAQVSHHIALAKQAAVKTTEKAQDEGDAAAIVGKLRGADGFVDLTKIDGDGAMLDNLLSGVPDARRDGVRQQLREQISLDASRKKAAVDGLKDKAGAIFNQSHRVADIPQSVLVPLNTYEPDYVYALQQREHTLQRERITDARGDRTAAADARRAQAEADKFALETFMALPPEQRATTNLSTFLAPLGVSRVGGAAIAAHQTATKTQVENGVSAAETRFVSEATAQSKALISPPKKGAPPLNSPEHLRSEASQAFQQFYSEHKRPPNAEERTKLISDLKLNEKREQAWSWGPFSGKRIVEKPAFEWRAEDKAGDEMVPIIVTKTGRPGKVPKAKLDAALSAGAVKLP